MAHQREQSLKSDQPRCRAFEADVQRKGCTAAQLALAWVLAHGDNAVSIPGTKRRLYLKENIAALAVRLIPRDLAEIDHIVPPVEPQERATQNPECRS